MKPGKIWASFPGKKRLPKQGWKIHISCIPSNAHQIFKICRQAAQKLGFSFKVFASLDGYISTCHGFGQNYTQKGKFITIYPSCYSDFVEIIGNLAEPLSGVPHYTIPFEKRFLKTPIYYRYGCISERSGWLKDDGGNKYLDDRTKYRPEFVHDPLIEYMPQEDKSDRRCASAEILRSDYKIEEALTQKGRGGNYLALDTKRQRPVFIKEGRLFSDHDRFGRNGLSRIENEAYFVDRLRKAGLPVHDFVDRFRSSDFSYLVYPYVEGGSLESLDLEHRVEICRDIIDIVAEAHGNGIIFGDLKCENFLIVDGQVKIIDLETASDQTWDSISNGFTRAYSPRTKNLSPIKRDLYALGVAICFYANGLDARKRFKTGHSLRKLHRSLPFDLRQFARKSLFN